MTQDIEVKHIPLKRIFDLAFSGVVLVLLLPVLAVFALMVKLTSKGPILFGHKRIGRGGKTFLCYKFRTMYTDSKERLERLLENETVREEWEANFKLKNDPRVTPLGRFMRKYSLDEFPQFWNVFVGDMSIAGPRPMIEDEIQNKVGGKAHKILSVRPGITGLWQVSGRSNTSYDQRIALDEAYIEKRNLLFDLKLIVMTIPCLLFSRGAY